MASAKKEAQKALGSVEDYINLSGLNKERELANQVYNTNYNSLQNSYNDLLSTIESNRQKARTDFGTGRSTIAENAYLRNRSDLSDLASRGLSGGVAQLSKLGNRMETGRQYSDLANTYYNTLNDLDATQKTGTNEYNTNLELARNNLDLQLADIGAREASGRNAYNATVAQLAEQIQARRDAAAQAAAALKAQKAQYDKQINALLVSDIDKIVGDSKTIDDNMYKKLIQAYKLRMGGNDTDAKNWLSSRNYYMTTPSLLSTLADKVSTSTKSKGSTSSTAKKQSRGHSF